MATEAIRYGFRAELAAAPCGPRWRTARGPEIVAPRYFGYNVDSVPFEQLTPRG